MADRFSERALVLVVLGRERWMLSITHIRSCQKVLRQPAYQPHGAVLRICNDFTVTRSHPLPGARDGGFIEFTCMCDSFVRMLSITVISRYHAVLRKPAYRPVSAVPRLRNVKTVTRSPLLEELVATDLSSVRSLYVERGRF